MMAWVLKNSFPFVHLGFNVHMGSDLVSLSSFYLHYVGKRLYHRIGKGEQMNDYKERMNRIVRNVAEQAWRPLLPSGLWFHGDVRDNFYYASYLFAASLDLEIDPKFNRQEGKRLAEGFWVVSRLQNKDAKSDVRTLAAEPGAEAGESAYAPVELMGSLMVFIASLKVR